METTLTEIINTPIFIRESILRIFSWLGVDIVQFWWLSTLVYLVFSLAIALLGLLLARIVLRTLLTPMIVRSKNTFDDALLNSNTLKWIARTVPFLILYLMYPAIFDDQKLIFVLLKNIFALALLIPVTMVLLSFLSAITVFYNGHSFAKQRPIKGYVQIVKVIIFIAAFLASIGILFNISPLGIFGGLGALSAVVLLVFKDPILSLVASTQLTLNNMVQIGDWVEIPAHAADGEIIDMNLQSVRIQNWNKTVVSVPVYDLIARSFINWRGMQESGGRRIKRAINIDMDSIQFCTPEMIKKFKEYTLLREYIRVKESAIVKENKAKGHQHADVLSSRAMTNIGTFRAYAFAYLKAHPCVSHSLTTMVRQLAPSAQGIPMEFYCFSNNLNWEAYESIQADIFDHMIAVIPVFHLRIFQNPSGQAIQNLAKEHRLS